VGDGTHRADRLAGVAADAYFGVDQVLLDEGGFVSAHKKSFFERRERKNDAENAEKKINFRISVFALSAKSLRPLRSKTAFKP
jgi:hypothetical protein